MNNREFKKLLKQETEKDIPNLKNQVLEAVGYHKEIPMKKSLRPRPIYFIPGILVGCLLLVFSFTQKSMHSIITLSSNPSIEFETNDQNKLIAVRALNKDGLLVIKNQEKDLLDLGLEKASIQVLETMIHLEYLSSSEEETLPLTLYVANESNQEKENNLSNSLVKAINDGLKEYEIEVSEAALSDKIQKQAQNYHTTYGKMQLIEKATTTSDLSIKKLSSYSIKKIDEIANQYEEKDLTLFSKEYDLYMEKFATEMEKDCLEITQEYDRLKSILAALIISCKTEPYNFTEINGLFDYLKNYCFQEYQDAIVNDTNLERFLNLFEGSDQKLDFLYQLNISVFTDTYSFTEGYMKNVIKYHLEQEAQVTYEENTFKYHPYFNTSLTTSDTKVSNVFTQMEKINCIISMFENTSYSTSSFYLENLKDLQELYEAIVSSPEDYTDIKESNQFIELEKNYLKNF